MGMTLPRAQVRACTDGHGDVPVHRPHPHRSLETLHHPLAEVVEGEGLLRRLLALGNEGQMFEPHHPSIHLVARKMDHPESGRKHVELHALRTWTELKCGGRSAVLQYPAEFAFGDAVNMATEDAANSRRGSNQVSQALGVL